MTLTDIEWQRNIQRHAASRGLSARSLSDSWASCSRNYVRQWEDTGVP